MPHALNIREIAAREVKSLESGRECIYPLPDEWRRRYEAEAVSAEPYEVEDGEFVLDGDAPLFR